MDLKLEDVYKKYLDINKEPIDKKEKDSLKLIELVLLKGALDKKRVQVNQVGQSSTPVGRYGSR